MSAVKELSEAAKFVCAVANAIAEAAADGKISLADATHLVPLMYKLPAAVDGLNEVVLADIGLDELAVIVADVKEALDLPNDKAEAIVECSLEVCVKLYELALKFKA